MLLYDEAVQVVCIIGNIIVHIICLLSHRFW